MVGSRRHERVPILKTATIQCECVEQAVVCAVLNTSQAGACILVAILLFGLGDSMSAQELPYDRYAQTEQVDPPASNELEQRPLETQVQLQHKQIEVQQQQIEG